MPPRRRRPTSRSKKKTPPKSRTRPKRPPRGAPRPKPRPKPKIKPKPKARTTKATESAPETKPPTVPSGTAPEPKPTTGVTEEESAPEIEEREEAQAAETAPSETPPFEEREEAQAADTTTAESPPEFEEREEAQAVDAAAIASELPRVPPPGSPVNVIEISSVRGTGTFNFLSVDGPAIEIKESTATLGDNQFATSANITREFRDITIVRNFEPAQALLDWFAEALNARGVWERDLKIFLPNRLWILKDCFLTKYEISNLDSTESKVAIKETIGICVGYIENI